MWTEAAKWLGKFDGAVLTMLDADGYPASVRVDSAAYDAGTGELLANLPSELHIVDGPANLLCHYHDEKLWKLNMISIKGRVENRDGAWVFATTAFNAPGKLAMLSFFKGVPRRGPEVSRQARSQPSASELGVGQGDCPPGQSRQRLKDGHTASRLSAHRSSEVASCRCALAEIPSSMDDSTPITAVWASARRFAPTRVSSSERARPRGGRLASLTNPADLRPDKQILKRLPRHEAQPRQL